MKIRLPVDCYRSDSRGSSSTRWSNHNATETNVGAMTLTNISEAPLWARQSGARGNAAKRFRENSRNALATKCLIPSCALEAERRSSAEKSVRTTH